MAKTITMTAVVLALAIGGGAFFVGYLMGNDWLLNSNPSQITPTIDGIIEKREWLRSTYYNIPFYLDIDNTIDPLVHLPNVDGWNYLSVAEDEDFYYIALDLCSDRTNNTEDEWLALHLANRIPDTYGSKLAFYSLEDFGYEYLYYDVSNDEVFDFYLNANPGTIPYYDIPIVPEMDTFDVLRGSIDGDLYDMWTEYDDKNLTATSIYYESQGIWLAGDFLDLHFGINVTEKIPDEIIPAFMASISDMDLHYTLRSNLTSNPPAQYGDPSLIYFCLYEHGPTPGNISDFSFVDYTTDMYFPANSISQGSVNLDYTRMNLTDGMFYFTLHCWNDPNPAPAGYEIQFDKLSLKITGGDIASLIGSTVAESNYELAFSFGSSDNCEDGHRMFEFKIAKSEFPDLDDDFLYLNVAGYGTMMMAGSNYWMYPFYDFPIPPMFDDLNNKLEFLVLDMSAT